ncbi:hypothetical protein HYV80_03675 [Candidatus Woesearchaeota archaeon]|nr:hypothetical protein [Candidatus Woesearchaeota archaeon]
METEILSEIRNSEKRAEETLEKAKREKEMIVQEAMRSSSKLLSDNESEIKKAHEKKILDFREKARLIREEKLAEGKTAIKQSKSKADKNTPKAVELVIKKFEEAV